LTLTVGVSWGQQPQERSAPVAPAGVPHVVALAGGPAVLVRGARDSLQRLAGLLPVIGLRGLPLRPKRGPDCALQLLRQGPGVDGDVVLVRLKARVTLTQVRKKSDGCQQR
jgi:hypothetical protein